MKLAIVVSIYLLSLYATFAQSDEYVYRVVQIQPEQTISLSVVDARSYLPVTIPSNAVEWHISFACFVDAKSIGPLNLLAQVSRLVDPTGFASVAANAISCPSGTGKCDVEITNRENRIKFMSGPFSGYHALDEISRKNLTQGVIQVPGKYQGKLEILLYNGSLTTSVVVRIEVTAVIREKKARTAEQERAINYGSLGWKAYENGNLDQCIEWSKKALALDPTLGWVCSNIGLCLLIKGDQGAAVDYYMDALAAHRLQPANAKKHLRAEIKDIDDAIERYPTMTGYKEIRDLLESELKRY